MDKDTSTKFIKQLLVQLNVPNHTLLLSNPTKTLEAIKHIRSCIEDYGIGPISVAKVKSTTWYKLNVTVQTSGVYDALIGAIISDSREVFPRLSVAVIDHGFGDIPFQQITFNEVATHAVS